MVFKIKNILQKNKLWYSIEWILIIFFTIIKLIIHLLVISNFDLHRDDYLYYAESEHLSWSYFSSPPTTALFGKLGTLLFGNTILAIRFFPALIGALTICVIGLFVKELGGKWRAITLASLAFILSPFFLHANFMLQPVSFEIFYWVLSGYLILRLIKDINPKFWIGIGIVFGLAFLAKYSIVFFVIAFLSGLLLSPYRKLFASKYFFIGLLLGFVTILPNLLWQYQNSFPVIKHMSELRERQLVHVKLTDFIIEQFLVHAQAIFIWLVALFILLFNKKEKRYQFFGLSFIILIALFALTKGKSYYTGGVFPILYVFGAYYFEKYIKKYSIAFFSFLIVFMFFALYISFSFDGVPLMSFEKSIKKEAYRWEDGKYYDLPQDMADMTGWREIGNKVKDIYLELGENNKDNCDIFCYHYGQAGAVMFYGKEKKLPLPISFNDCFLDWSPDSLTKDYMIWVHTDLHNDFKPDSILPLRFKIITLKHTINNKYFRENGTRIFLCEYPTVEYKNYYKSIVNRLKNE